MKFVIIRFFRIYINLYNVILVLGVPVFSSLIYLGQNVSYSYASMAWKFNLLIIGTPMLIVLIVTSLKYFSHYNLNKQENIQEFLERSEDKDRITLILRPFGRDGSVFFNQGDFFRKVYILEDLIQKKCGGKLISIKNPRESLNINSMGPLSVVNNELWKKDVKKIVYKSDFVVFIFTKKSKLSSSMMWELKEAFNSIYKKNVLVFFIKGSDISEILSYIDKVTKEGGSKFTTSTRDVIAISFSKNRVIISKSWRKSIESFESVLSNFYSCNNMTNGEMLIENIRIVDIDKPRDSVSFKVDIVKSVLLSLKLILIAFLISAYLFGQNFIAVYFENTLGGLVVLLIYYGIFNVIRGFFRWLSVYGRSVFSENSWDQKRGFSVIDKNEMAKKWEE